MRISRPAMRSLRGVVLNTKPNPRSKRASTGLKVMLRGELLLGYDFGFDFGGDHGVFRVVGEELDAVAA